MGDDNVNLPPGFHFYPSDEELVVHFLYPKAARLPSHNVIPDLDLHPYDPWELHGKALAGGSSSIWYFFSRRVSHRVSANGYWNPMGIDEPIVNTCRKRVGMKKFLVFHLGEAPFGMKTNWIMHEFRLSDSASSTSTTSSSRSSKKRAPPKHDKLVLCRVFEQDDGSQGSLNGNDEDGPELSCLDEVFLSLDDLDEISLPN